LQLAQMQTLLNPVQETSWRLIITNASINSERILFLWYEAHLKIGKANKKGIAINEKDVK